MRLYPLLAFSLSVFSLLIKPFNSGLPILKQFVLLILAEQFPLDSPRKPDIILVWLYDGFLGDLGAQVIAGPCTQRR